MYRKEKVVEKPYKYFDTPDGQDTIKKLACVLKPTVFIAAGVANFEVLMMSRPKGYKAIATRYAYVALPIVGITSTFVLATNSIASLRKKDDRLNWFLGGFVTGSCFGLWRRQLMFGFNMGMLCGILGFLRKEALNHGWELIPENTKIRRGGATTCLNDWSLTAERPKGWTTGIQ